jgi:alpha-N-arabinofuranosidase
LIQNRAFQGTTVNVDSSGAAEGPFQTLQYWHTSGSDTLTLDNDAPHLTSALPWQMRVDVAEGATGPTGFWNEGYWGMNITTATRYAANFYLRGNYNGQILCAFWSNTTNSMLGSTTFTVSQSEADGWVPYAQTFTTTASAPDADNTFHLTFDGASTAGTSLRFQMISVFQQTYKNSNNGLRIDLAEAVNEIGGKYLRMPGGNNMEGLSAPYQWKWNETIGPIINRPGRPGTWGYVNTDGLGLLEMMQANLSLPTLTQTLNLTILLLVVS